MDKQGSGWRNTPTSKMKGYHLTAQSIVHPLTSSLCLSNQSAPCLGQAVQGALLTTTTIMTREDVRAQLAKNPLVWRVIHDGTTSRNTSRCIHRSNLFRLFDDMSAFYSIRIQRKWSKNGILKLEGVLLLVVENEEAIRLYGEESDEYVIGEASKQADALEPCRIEKLESMAENHRLDIICKMLGINN